MTLGPKFFSCNQMAITRRTKHLRKRKALIFEALVETHLSSYSKRDLKQFPKNWPWFLRLSKSINVYINVYINDYINDYMNDYINDYFNDYFNEVTSVLCDSFLYVYATL